MAICVVAIETVVLALSVALHHIALFPSVPGPVMIVTHAAYDLPMILLPTISAGGSMRRAFSHPSMLGSTVWATALFPSVNGMHAIVLYSSQLCHVID